MRLFKRRQQAKPNANAENERVIEVFKQVLGKPDGLSVSLCDGAVKDIEAAEAALRETIEARLVKPRTTEMSLTRACLRAVSPHLSGDGLWAKVEKRYRDLSTMLAGRLGPEEAERRFRHASRQGLDSQAAREIRSYANGESRRFAAEAATGAFESYAEDGEANAKNTAKSAAKIWSDSVKRLAIGTLAARMFTLGASLSARWDEETPT